MRTEFTAYYVRPEDQIAPLLNQVRQVLVALSEPDTVDFWGHFPVGLVQLGSDDVWEDVSHDGIEIDAMPLGEERNVIKRKVTAGRGVFSRGASARMTSGSERIQTNTRRRSTERSSGKGMLR